MKIKPTVGIDSIKLGMTMAQVELLWGKPNSTQDSYHSFYSDDRPKAKITTWEYHEGIKLNFWSLYDSLLTNIDTCSPSSIFENIKLIGLSEKELWLKFPNAGRIEEEDDEHGWLKEYFIDEHGLVLWVEEGKVTAVAIYPEYNRRGDIPIWPL